jgi:hypothetical protein
MSVEMSEGGNEELEEGQEEGPLACLVADNVLDGRRPTALPSLPPRVAPLVAFIPVDLAMGHGERRFAIPICFFIPSAVAAPAPAPIPVAISGLRRSPSCRGGRLHQNSY